MFNWKYWYAFLLSMCVHIHVQYRPNSLPIYQDFSLRIRWEYTKRQESAILAFPLDLGAFVSPPTLSDAHILPTDFLLWAWQAHLARCQCGNLKLASLSGWAHLFLHVVCGIFPSALDFTLPLRTLAMLIVLPLLLSFKKKAINI